jgi:hypothetical protein
VKPPEQTEPLAVLERKLTGHTDWIFSVVVSPDGKWAASGSEDTVKVWDLAIAGEANQIFRSVTMFDYGIDGEVEFKDNDGRASGKKVYVQLKSGNSYLRTGKGDGSEVFDVKDERHLNYWTSQPVDVYLVVRQKDETSGQEIIRWMNVMRYLKNRKGKKSRQVIFEGEKFDMEAVWKVREAYFAPMRARARNG